MMLSTNVGGAVPVPRFFSKMAAAGFKFDKMADRWATGDTRPNGQILDALRHTKEGRFRVPGAPPEAPLCHLVIHAEDNYRPLGIDHTINPQSANIVLEQLTTPQPDGRSSPACSTGSPSPHTTLAGATAPAPK